MIAQLLALTIAAPAAGADGRRLDPAVPTAVAAPQDEVPVDGAALEGPKPPQPAAPAVAPPPPAARAAEDEPRGPRKWPPSKRRGVLVSAGIGAGGCGQDECEPLKAVAWLNLTGGYRFGRFAPILTVQGAFGPADPPAGFVLEGELYGFKRAKDSRQFLHVGAGTLLHLLASTPFDPYFGVTIGYLQTRARFVAEADVGPDVYEADTTSVVHRGALGIIIGMNFRVRERFTIGPRVDVLVPFAGKYCLRHIDEGRSCRDLGDVEEFDPGQYFPRPWAVTLQLGAVI